jgi:hypothetical protein
VLRLESGGIDGGSRLAMACTRTAGSRISSEMEDTSIILEYLDGWAWESTIEGGRNVVTKW